MGSFNAISQKIVTYDKYWGRIYQFRLLERALDLTLKAPQAQIKKRVRLLWYLSTSTKALSENEIIPPSIKYQFHNLIYLYVKCQALFLYIVMWFRDF